VTRRGYALVAAGVAAAGALAAGLVLAFAGGHSHAANDPTPAAYLASVAAICNRYGHRLDRVPPAIDPAIQGDAKASIDEALPLLRGQTRAIRALPRPAALRPKLERFFALNDRSIRALERGLAAIRVNDVPRLSRALTDFSHARDRAKLLGRQIGFRC
jgi:hypothetical protein